MYRLRTTIPILLLSSLVTPAIGETGISYCAAVANSPRCEAERAREFAAARNAEINASIAAVNAARVWLTAARTHCKAANSTTPRCEAERARELALARTHCKSPDSTTPRCEAERAREFAAARNAEIDASMAAVQALRAREFAAARNLEINASVAAVEADRARQFAAARNAEINASLAAVAAARRNKIATTQTPEMQAWVDALNAQYEKIAFAVARNAEIDASMETVKAVREFEHARNAEIAASMAAVEAERARVFAKARNAEINASMAAVEAERTRSFAAARNAEINASLAAVKTVREFELARNAEIDRSMIAAKAQRALRLAIDASRGSRVETGAISLPDTLNLGKSASPVRQVRNLGPCREATHVMSPLEFSPGNAAIEPDMKSELDRIVMMARSCPSIRIEIHGHSDNSGPAQINRRLAERRAQAAAAYLVGSGVDRKRLSAIGHAESQPLVPNSDEDNRAVNRRVEVVIQDPAMQAAAQRLMWDLAEVLDPNYIPPLARLSP
jgi:outer membrane protein OmpA-like peptidoglycan-associated protein